MKNGKVWGNTQQLLSTPLFSLHLLHIKPKHQCSLHVHRRKSNGFIVQSGRLFIDVVKNDYPLTDTTELGPGEFMTVPPGEHHRFRTGDEPCTAWEFYYLEPLADDIDRKDHGGEIPDDE